MSTSKPSSGHQYLLSYKLTVPIYDYTVTFCNRYIKKSSRTHDQMVQAARSGMQNVAEGYKQQSLKSYIKLAGVTRGSLEELLGVYEAYARQHNLSIRTREQCMREIGEIGVIWDIVKNNSTLPNPPNFPTLPTNTDSAVNLLITLIHQTNYLLDKLVISLKEKHRREGGFIENLYKTRKQYRGY